MRRAHRHQHQMRALVTESRNGESNDATTIAGDQRHRFAVCEQLADAPRAILPAQACLDKVPRHGSDLLRVVIRREPQCDACKLHSRNTATSAAMKVLFPRVGARTFAARLEHGGANGGQSIWETIWAAYAQCRSPGGHSWNLVS